MTEKQRNLKNILINPSFQLKHALWTLLTGLILVGLYSFFVYKKIEENYIILVDASPMDEEVKKQMWLELDQFILNLGMYSVIFLVLACLLGFFLSHKVAGPLYKLKTSMDLIKEGKIEQRVQFRSGDEFQGVATSFNEMMDSLNLKS